MNKQKILFVIGALVIVTMACGYSVDLPIRTDVKTGPTVTEEILIEAPEDASSTTYLTLAFGAGEIYLTQGAGEALINGTASYNVDDLRPEISYTGNNIKIETGSLEFDGIPNFRDQVVNTWDFELGNTPIDLTVKAGAYTGEFEFGGLALSNLHVADGASNLDINFSSPNLIEMQTLHYETGASDISLHNLANANFTTMIFESGAGNYNLDFFGELKRDGVVFVESGLSNLEINVPGNANVQVSVTGGLTNISTRGNWDQSGNQYKINGDGPTLTITIDMSAGNLVLRAH